MNLKKPGGTLTAFLAGAAATLAAGGYFLYGPEGRRHRRQATGFIEGMKAKILERMEDAKDVSHEAYNRIVDEVIADAGIARRLGRTKTAQLAQRFKERWEDMKAELADAAAEAELELELEDVED